MPIFGLTSMMFILIRWLLKKNEFSTIPNAQNENESKGEIENER
jgi:hypothetical protein